MTLRFLPVNLDAFLIELEGLEQTMALVASLQEESIEGIDEIVPAARTVLVCFDRSRTTAPSLVAQIGARPLGRWSPARREQIEIPVHYDGEDLSSVAALLGITTAEVVKRHTAGDYVAAFLGFAPGFAYLTAVDGVLDVPRRTVPRTRVPAGAVALGGAFSGVYPQASPGGWQIIGTSPLAMWNLDREAPALLRVGDRVRFVDASANSGAALRNSPSSRANPVPPPQAADDRHLGATLQVTATGLQALMQDEGRRGRAGQGVAASGAMDRRSLRIANGLVGNEAGTACVELACGGARFASHGHVVAAVTGAEGPLEVLRRTGARIPLRRHEAFALNDGDELFLGEPLAGVRSYLAVRGGFAARPVLGSLSTDTLAHVGPKPLAGGDVLRVAPCLRGAIVQSPAPPPHAWPSTGRPFELDVVLGPRTDWVTTEAIALLCTQTWRVTSQSNRVGIRLHGETPLERALHAEMASEGTALGAIQVPPSGQPVLFMADHPLTGGYPVIASVATYHLDLAGQIPIHAGVRFKVVPGPLPLE